MTNLACAVCSGASDAAVAPAVNASVGLLLCVIAVVGGCFFRFLLYLARCDGMPSPLSTAFGERSQLVAPIRLAPKGSQRREAIVPPSFCDPSGVNRAFEGSGGIAALNPRLLSGTPPGCPECPGKDVGNGRGTPTCMKTEFGKGSTDDAPLPPCWPGESGGNGKRGEPNADGP
jgi:hypothetical protein